MRTVRICRACETEKPLEAFSLVTRLGRRTRRRVCKECRHPAQAEYCRAYRERRGLKGYDHRPRSADGRWL